MSISRLQQAINDTRTLNENFNVISDYILRGEQNVLVHLYAAEGSPTWEDYKVFVLDRASGLQHVYDINSEGVCEFAVEMGHIYEVSLPTIGGYVAPEVQTYSAASLQQTITYTYATETSVETLRILVTNGMTGRPNTCLNGVTLSVYCTDGSTYSGVTDGAVCEIEIPYGKTYTFTPINAAGYRLESGAVTYTAGIVQRTTTIKYTEVQYGMFGVDAAGNLYTVAEMEALADKTIIKYGYYNDADLANSTRVNEAPNGNGFYWEIGAENIGSMAWAAGNVEFDTIRLPFYSNLGAWKYAGRYMTDTIISIGADLFPSSQSPTPAATACANKSITIGGTAHRGFLLAYDQIKKIATDNRTTLQAFYAALGRTTPAIWSGHWWTSCQFNATGAVILRNGGFNNDNKTNSYNVFCAFDL